MEDRTRERHTCLLGGWNLPCFNVTALKNKLVLEDAVGLFNKRMAGTGLWYQRISVESMLFYHEWAPGAVSSRQT